MGRLFRPCKPQPAPKPLRARTTLGGEFLECRNVPDYIYALAQTALLGEAALYVAASLRTPEQVLLHGWGDRSDDPAVPQADRAAAPLRADVADVAFLNLTVTPPAEVYTPPPAPEQTTSTQPTRAAEPAQDEEQEPLALVAADEALAPVFDQDFLDQAKRLLAVPLPSDDAGPAGSVASPEEATRPEATGRGDDGPFGGPSGGGLADPAPAAGAGASGASSDDGFNPFLSTNATAPRNAGPLAAATPDALALPPVLPLAPGPAVPFDTPTLAAPPGTPTPAPSVGGQTQTPAPVVVPAPPTLMPGFALPLSFAPNEGQGPDGSAYLAQGAGYGIALAPDGLMLALSPAARNAATPTPPELLHIHFAGATPDPASLHPSQELVGRANYFRAGAPPLTDVPTYAAVTQELAPGVSVVYHGNGPNLQFDFELAPGVDPATVAMSYEGIRGATVDDQGQLLLHTPGGHDLLVQAPVLYQTAADGTRQDVAGGYSVHPDGSVGFHLDAGYDPSRGLVLDPTLLMSSYLGGSGTDNGNAVFAGPDGSTYWAGTTSSSNFPTLNAYDSTLGGTGDAFLSKVSAAGVLLYSTYLGGVMLLGDAGLAVTVDAAGHALLTGQAGSTDFPTTTGAYQTTLSGTTDAFATEFSTAGNALVFSTLLGGSGTETGRALAVAGDGSVVVAGQSGSSNFPVASAAQSTYGGSNDGFVSKLKPDGSGLSWSTYAGGTGSDDLRGLALDASGRVVVIGTTGSTGLGSTGAYQTTLSGTQDVLVRRYTASGALDWSTYAGGTATEGGDAVSLDSTGQVYLAGWTQSTGLATTGAYQTALSGTQDALIGQLSADGTRLNWLSYLGGSGSEEATGLGVDASQNVYAAGLTDSSTNFPLSNAVQSGYGGGLHDAFVTAFNAGGASLAWSTYLGGNGDDTAAGLALDLDNNAYCVGSTASSNFPVQSAFQSSNGGGTDAFLAKLAPLPPPAFTTISNDTGASSTDGITTGQNQSLLGTSLANATITLYRAGTGKIGTATANSGGSWTFDYTGTTLPEGVIAFTATADRGANPSVPTAPFFVTVDRTAPLVTVYNDPTTYATTPQLWVTATDLHLAATTTVTLDVDTNNDGNFTDAGETGYLTATMSNGLAWVTLSPALAIGTVGLRARVTDLAGNQGTSATSSLQVLASGSGYATTDLTPLAASFTGNVPVGPGPMEPNPYVPWPGFVGFEPDPNVPWPGFVGFEPDPNVPIPPGPIAPNPNVPWPGWIPPDPNVPWPGWIPPDPNVPMPVVKFFGPMWPLLQRDELQVIHDLDLDQSPGTAVGGSPSLDYNSERVNVRPIVQGEFVTDNSQGLPPTITATLTIQGLSGSSHTYNTTGLSPGLLVVAQQTTGVASTSGRYPYELDVSLNYAIPIQLQLIGVVYVIVEDGSPYGVGWTMGSVDRLISVPQQTLGTYTFAPGMLREYGDEGYAFYTDNGAGGYTSPPGDNGTLTVAGGTYTYTRPDGSQQTFDSGGNMIQAISSDGFAIITYTYGGSGLTGVATPDGALTTLAYSSGKVTTIQTGPRTVTLTIDGSSNLTGLANPDGGLRTVAYDSTHHLSDDRFDVLRGTYAYTHNVPTAFTMGDMSSDPSAGRYTLSPGVLVGLDSLGKAPVWTSVTDPLGRTTRLLMDRADSLQTVVAPDGGTTTFTRDSNEWITSVTDPLRRVTTLVRDTAGYITQVIHPDLSFIQNTYQVSHHAQTAYQDELFNRTTYSYDSGNGHLLTIKDALNQVTTLTYYLGMEVAH